MPTNVHRSGGNPVLQAQSSRAKPSSSLVLDLSKNLFLAPQLEVEQCSFRSHLEMGEGTRSSHSEPGLVDTPLCSLPWHLVTTIAPCGHSILNVLYYVLSNPQIEKFVS